MAKGKKVLTEPEFDRFCFEELIPRAIDVRQAVASLSGGRAGGENCGVPADLSEVHARLHRLREATEVLARSLNSLEANRPKDKLDDPPLMLVNPLGVSPKYAIERVLEKVAGQRR